MRKRIKVEQRVEFPLTPSWEPTPKLTEAILDKRMWWVPFSALVEAGTGDVISTASVVNMEPFRLSVDPQVAGHFRIFDIKIGNLSQVLSLDAEEGVPGTLFPPIPTGLSDEERQLYEELLAMKFNTVQVQHRVAITVRNEAPYKSVFSAVLWGKVKE